MRREIGLSDVTDVTGLFGFLICITVDLLSLGWSTPYLTSLLKYALRGSRHEVISFYTLVEIRSSPGTESKFIPEIAVRVSCSEKGSNSLAIGESLGRKE